ncbi:DNA-binding transcriptional MerR regulator/peroxiredoxin [Microbacterium resistens]|uniref:DNA-binding transcriptional MerR regulator/peroxiredoxin n=1 Tax=Microbacterium resistens TaxID=156977 RepID=A0ABU1SHE2_9MICO|nr:MerR family transcriptional regulator [Microbacterium resistens]MDR6868388.1 DNA-binding transcriptional MerR regulator/peroxiredoxin [Microbacterium resistens]
MSEMLRVGEVSAEVGVSSKALRGYEERGLVVPARGENGYRLYDRHQVRVVAQISRLNALGISLRDMHAFVDCLNTDSEYADACPSTLTEYRRAIDRIDRTVAVLSAQRDALVQSLSAASRRMLGELAELDAANPNLAPLPADLPAPVDDGAADALLGRRLPAIQVESTDGERIDLGDLGAGRTLVYVFPMTGAPEQDMPDGWDAIPGARGCSPHNCDMRDHYVELVQAGVQRVYGLSSQPAAYQRALVEALRLPYPLLTDETLSLAADPGLPVLRAADLTVYRRLALIVLDGVIEHVFFPIFPPDRHAQVVLDWLRANPR